MNGLMAELAVTSATDMICSKSLWYWVRLKLLMTYIVWAGIRQAAKTMLTVKTILVILLRILSTP